MGLMVDSMIDREMTPFRQSNREADLNTPFVQRKTDTAMDAGKCGFISRRRHIMQKKCTVICVWEMGTLHVLQKRARQLSPVV